MKKIAKKQLGPRADLKTEKFLQEWFGNANAGAEYAIELVHVLFKGTLQKQWGRFTRGELMLMLEGMRDRDLVAASAGHGFLNEIEYSLHHGAADKRWNVEKKDFISKIKALSVPEAAFLEIWAHAYWKSDRLGEETMKEWAQKLTD